MANTRAVPVRMHNTRVGSNENPLRKKKQYWWNGLMFDHARIGGRGEILVQRADDHEGMVFTLRPARHLGERKPEYKDGAWWWVPL